MCLEAASGPKEESRRPFLTACLSQYTANSLGSLSPVYVEGTRQARTWAAVILSPRSIMLRTDVHCSSAAAFLR